MLLCQKPINGFRYKCSKCKDHDICESCHTTFLSGTLPHANKLNPMVSKDVSAHSFHAYVDGKSFKAIGGGKKTEPAVKKAKVKPNDPCTCNSGKVRQPSHTQTHTQERSATCREPGGTDQLRRAYERMTRRTDERGDRFSTSGRPELWSTLTS